MKSIESQGASDAVPPSFREHLQAELARRCADNPHYSLRAFALDLGTDHATLSQLLRGRRNFTVATIERLGARLRLPADALEAFAQRAWASESPADDDAQVLELATLSQYAAAIVTEWEHFAILELTRVEGFRPDVAWIARVLDVSTDTVVLAVNRLLHLGMLTMVDERTWVDRSERLVARGAPGAAGDFARATARALLERAHALAPPSASVDLPQETTSITLAVSLRRVPEAIQRLRALRYEIVDLLDASTERDEVYRLDVRLVPLTNTSRKH